MLLSIVVNLLSSVNDNLQSASQAASPLILSWSDPALMIAVHSLLPQHRAVLRSGWVSPPPVYVGMWGRPRG